MTFILLTWRQLKLLCFTALYVVHFTHSTTCFYPNYHGLYIFHLIICWLYAQLLLNFYYIMCSYYIFDTFLHTLFLLHCQIITTTFGLFSWSSCVLCIMNTVVYLIDALNCSNYTLRSLQFVAVKYLLVLKFKQILFFFPCPIKC